MCDPDVSKTRGGVRVGRGGRRNRRRSISALFGCCMLLSALHRTL